MNAYSPRARRPGLAELRPFGTGNIASVANIAIAAAIAMTIISGNSIGMNAAGTVALDNAGDGVLLDHAHAFVISNTIEDNAGDGVSLADGAEGNGIGVGMKFSSGGGRDPLPVGDYSVMKLNTIQGNGRYQVHMAGGKTMLNFVSGYNHIDAPFGGTAIYLDGARANVIGDGGEGSDPASGYVVGPNSAGNWIGYGDDGNEIGYGIEDTLADGAEGNAYIGNQFMGELANAIVTAYPGIVRPLISAASSSAPGDGSLRLNLEYTVPDAGRVDDLVRVDFYLINPTTGEVIMLPHEEPIDPTNTQSVSFNVTAIDPSITDEDSLSGWFLGATATYNLEDENNASLPAGAITSSYAVFTIP